MIKLVEIEIFNYCNRSCGFCPNSKSKRNDLNNIKYLDFDSFKRLIDELSSIGFNGVYTFSRYNEPMAFPKVLKKYIKYIRSRSYNKIVTNTNGDFVDTKTITLFDEVSIMDYDGKGTIFWVDKLYNMKIRDVEIVTEDNVDKFIRCKIKNTEILVFLNFIENASIEDRGGVIEPKFKMKNEHNLRYRPCYEPMHFLGIDYTGDVMPCCNLRHDFHESCILGNINKESILDILSSKKRNQAIKNGLEINLDFCKRCQKDPGRYTRNSEPGILYKGERK